MIQNFNENNITPNIFDEFVKCKNDFVYFCENYIKIIHLTRGIIPFTLYDYHKRLKDFINENQHVIIKKFRQGGFSSFFGVYGLHKCLFQKNLNFVIALSKQYDCHDFFHTIDQIISRLPKPFKYGLDYNKKSIKIHSNITNSTLHFLKPSQIQDLEIDYLFLDEAAWMKDIGHEWIKIYPLIKQHGKCFVISTLNNHNWFSQLYERSELGLNAFKQFKCHWTEHPDYQNEKFITKVKNNLGQKAWMREFEGVLQ